MLVSVAWVREMCPCDATAGRIAEILTSRGLTVDTVIGDPSSAEAVLDVDVPANRPDCLGHRGIARELSAATGVPLARVPSPPAPAGGPVDQAVSVEIAAPEHCARYTARLVRGVRVGPSPPWVVRRLEDCGLRALDNVVDASNLVMLALGHPVHFFDLARLRGPRVIVRAARPGELLTTLDAVERKLDAADLVIADADRPLALAGVMGGADSEISIDTRDVLIEAAWFDPVTVRRTARRHGLHTDASHRFERGCDPEAPLAAQDLACRLLADLAGGVPAPGVLDVHPSPRRPRSLSLRMSRIARLLGYDPGASATESALSALALAPRRIDHDRFEVDVPSYRVDLETEADLVEEVARHIGYDQVPARVPAPTGSPASGTTHPLEERCRDLLAHAGFLEMFSYAMVAVGEDDPFVPPGTRAPLKLTNPIAEPLTCLRRSILPGPIAAAGLNARRAARSQRLFEVGRVFLPGENPGEFPEEVLRAGAVWGGPVRTPHWSEPHPPAVGFADLAGLVERALRGMVPGVDWTVRPHALPGLHPGRTAAWFGEHGDPLAWGGCLHPDLRARLEFADDLWLCEIDLDALARSTGASTAQTALPRVPAVVRDLSVVLAPDASFADLTATLERVPAPAPATFDAVDRYEGPPLGAGEAALTVRVCLQPLERSLEEDAIEGYRRGLIDALSSSGLGRLRA